MPGGGNLVVFSKLDLRIDAGSFTAFLGPSGCGKSTLLRLISGLELPDSGTISVETASDGVGRRAGLMHQRFPTLPWLTVAENVGLGMNPENNNIAQGIRTAAPIAQERANYYLGRVGLFGWQDARPPELDLSGGMLQRLALASTLAMDPDPVLLDEPLGALDALTRRELQPLIRELHETEGGTYLIVTHDVDEALAVADRVVVLGPAGIGVLYDSQTASRPLDRESLVRLLRSTHLTFAAGTWSGYVPVQKTSMRQGTKAYEFWPGLSDEDRLTALRSGRAHGAFLTIQALATLEHRLQDLDLKVVHAFSRPTTSAICEHVLLHPRARSRSSLQWLLPGDGLEAAIVRRLIQRPSRLALP